MVGGKRKKYAGPPRDLHNLMAKGKGSETCYPLSGRRKRGHRVHTENAEKKNVPASSGGSEKRKEKKMQSVSEVRSFDWA